MLVLAIVAFWFVALRPQMLGGPAAYVTVAGDSMQPHLATGDVVVLQRQDTYAVGDVVAYRIPKGQPGEGRVVIHRIVGRASGGGYVLRGDNRTTDDWWTPRTSDVLGKEQVRVPAVGRISRIMLTPIGLGILAGLAVAILIATQPAPRPRPASTPG